MSPESRRTQELNVDFGPADRGWHACPATSAKRSFKSHRILVERSANFAMQNIPQSLPPLGLPSFSEVPCFTATNRLAFYASMHPYFESQEVAPAGLSLTDPQVLATHPEPVTDPWPTLAGSSGAADSTHLNCLPPCLTC